MPNYKITELASLDPVACPCGEARRAFGDVPESPASMHLVRIDGEAKTHYHKRMTEIYYFLEGSGTIELDGESHAIKPGMAIMIKPGCQHRAVGKFTILNIAIPAFDPADEFLV